jgi:hypothetical protein
VRNADGKRLMSVPLSHAPWVPWLTVKLLGSEGGGGGEEKGGVGRKPDNGGGGGGKKQRGETGARAGFIDRRARGVVMSEKGGGIYRGGGATTVLTNYTFLIRNI